MALEAYMVTFAERGGGHDGLRAVLGALLTSVQESLREHDGNSQRPGDLTWLASFLTTQEKEWQDFCVSVSFEEYEGAFREALEKIGPTAYALWRLQAGAIIIL